MPLDFNTLTPQQRKLAKELGVIIDNTTNTNINNYVKEIRDRNIPSEIYGFYKDKIEQIEFESRKLITHNTKIFVNNIRIISLAKKIIGDIYIYCGNYIECIKDVEYLFDGPTLTSGNGNKYSHIKKDDLSSYCLETPTNKCGTDRINILLNDINIKKVVIQKNKPSKKEEADWYII